MAKKNKKNKVKSRNYDSFTKQREKAKKAGIELLVMDDELDQYNIIDIDDKFMPSEERLQEMGDELYEQLSIEEESLDVESEKVPDSDIKILDGDNESETLRDVQMVSVNNRVLEVFERAGYCIYDIIYAITMDLQLETALANDLEYIFNALLPSLGLSSLDELVGGREQHNDVVAATDHLMTSFKSMRTTSQSMGEIVEDEISGESILINTYVTEPFPEELGDASISSIVDYYIRDSIEPSEKMKIFAMVMTGVSHYGVTSIMSPILKQYQKNVEMSIKGVLSYFDMLKVAA